MPTFAEPPLAVVTPQQIASAESLYEAGKTQLLANEITKARDNLISAIALVPEPKYLYTLGVAEFQLGHFSESLTALESVFANNPTIQQAQMTRLLVERVLAECEAQNVTCQDMSRYMRPR